MKAMIFINVLIFMDKKLCLNFNLLRGVTKINEKYKLKK